MLAFPSAPSPTRVAPATWPRRASESQPSSPEARSQLTNFSKIPQILRARFRCMTSFTSTSQPFYLGFLF